MKQATLRIECDFCKKNYLYDKWLPDTERIPQPTIKILNKDICRLCCQKAIEFLEKKDKDKPKV